MNKEILSRAIDGIDESTIEETAAIREFSAKKHRKFPMAIAAAIALTAVGGVAAFAGGGLINVKNLFGTITGQEYVGDATDDFKVSFAGFGESGIEIKVEKTDPESKLDLKDCTAIPLSYTLSDSQGKTVFTSSGGASAPMIADFDFEGYLESGESGEPLFSVSTEEEAAPPEDGPTWWSSERLEPESWIHTPEELLGAIPEGYTPADKTVDTIESCYSGGPNGGLDYAVKVVHRRKYVNPNAEREELKVMFFPESEELLESGTYTLYLESFIIRKKGDQDLEVTGKWTTTFDIGEAEASE